MVKQKRGYYCGPASLQAIYPWLTQEELAKLAKTDINGTGVAGLKGAIRQLMSEYRVLKGKQKGSKWPTNDLIVYDPVRDHWMAVLTHFNSGLMCYFYDIVDPEHGTIQGQVWGQLRNKHLNTSNSYAIEVIKPNWMKRLPKS